MRTGEGIILIASLLLIGCAETPRQPVMRPIPPPPPFPPPGMVAYAQPQAFSTNMAAVTGNVTVSTNIIPPSGPGPGTMEVSSNFVAIAPAVTNVVGQPPAQSATPQYEIVPPRPGPNYVWLAGYWRWEGTWAWVPGQWIYQRPEVIFVPDPFFSYHYHFGGGPWRYGYRPHHRRWR